MAVESEPVDVAVVGGGLVGLGVARDLALRGLSVKLFEADGICSGASGRNHGLLHSGARYAPGDPDAAAGCARENDLLRGVAAPYIEPCGGLFVSTSSDENAYLEELEGALSRLNIPHRRLGRDAGWQQHWCQVLLTRDAFVNPFGLAAATAYHAQELGVEFHIDRVVGVDGVDIRTAGGDLHYAEVVVLACGWRDDLLKELVPGAPQLSPDRGTLLLTERRLHDMVVNRARPPGDGDIIVPGGNSSVIGTTSSPGTDSTPTREEVDLLVEEAAALFPQVRDMRLLRAYSGVRPLVGGNGDGRDVSRSHHVVTCDNIVAVLGGKLTTFRSMAEQASNEVCRMLGNVEKCTTGTEPLPDLTGDEYAVDNVCGCEGSTLNLPEKLLPLLGTAPHRFAGAGFGPCQGWRCLAHGSAEATAERWRGLRPVLHRGQFKQGYMLWARQRGMEGK